VNGSGHGVALSIRGLHKAFGGLVAVRELTFDVPDGAITGLIGPNGSGKTTVLNLVTGELMPDRGEIVLDGRDIAGWPPFRVCRARIARTFQLVRVLPTMTVRENVMLGAMFGSAPAELARAAAEADALIARVGLAGAEAMRGTQLTYIDQKRVELARALACRPRLLLLDEWLAGLNPTELQTGIALVRSIGVAGVAIVMVEHVMEAIRALCDSVMVMNAGELIAAGAPDDVLADPAVMRAYLGAEDDAAA
jgi:branched-chain amino acid transport system ATP-binding protein